MGIFQQSKRGQLKELQIQLANVNRQLEAMEKRAAHRTATNMREVTESPETRFAACVASGMSKLHGLVKSET
jgi:hypothetical protein